jgi:peptidoglycan/xylan/chitin deacetylase (PgdA/CDA1 family)
MRLTKLTSFAVISALTLSLFAAINPMASALGPNLVANPSMETANAAKTAPVNWANNKWGTNTATFQYRSDGAEGTRSVRVNMTKYTNGDAKWYFDAVTVTPGTVYTFSESYKSNVATSIVARSIDANGVESYSDVAVTVAASKDNWKTLSYNVAAPAGSAKMSILHIIKKVGWLQTDSVSFAAADATTPPTDPNPQPPATPVNSVPNPSVETVDPTNTNLPASWATSNWGTNSPTYQYVKTGGHGDTKSVKVTVRNYKDGDAKWVYTPQALTVGRTYKMSAWYKTNTKPHVVAQFIKSDGTESYFGMRDPEPMAGDTTNWQSYTDTFTVPEGTIATSVFMFINSNGWLQTDDYSVVPHTYPPLNRGLVTLTFDDGFEANITSVMPVLDQYGFKTTHCFATQFVEGITSAVNIVKQMAAGGHEICAHTVTHPDLTTLTAANLTYELQHSQAYLKSISGQPVNNFASPYGAYNPAVNAEIKKYYTSHRTTDEGYNTKDNLLPYRMRVQNMGPRTTLAEFQGWVNQAKADKTWLVLVYHEITTDPARLTDAEYNTKKADFDAQMAWLSTAGITVQRWDTALAEVSAQAQ